MQTGFVIDEAALKKGDRLFRSECTFTAGVQNMESMIESDLPEIAFAGRSNVGKSSLINALTGRKALARASSTPGRTQQLNFFNLGDTVHLVDLPGYGYAAASKTKIAAWNDLIRRYLRQRRNLKRVCLLIDARHGIKAVDQEAMEALDAAGAPYIVVLTKCDKLGPVELHALKMRVEEELKSFGGAFPVVYETSSSLLAGIPALRAVLAQL
jgi:GTP-binding protein